MKPTAPDIQAWIVARVSQLTGIAPEEIDPEADIARHGLDSVTLVVLAVDLEKWLGYRFRENPLEKHPTIAALSRHLAEQGASCP